MQYLGITPGSHLDGANPGLIIGMSLRDGKCTVIERKVGHALEYAL